MNLEELMDKLRAEADAAGLKFSTKYDPRRRKWRAEVGGYNVERPTLTKALAALLYSGRWRR